MKITLDNYGHDSRLYGGEVRLSDFDTEMSEYTTEESNWAKRIVTDWAFDNDCKFYIRCRKRSTVNDAEISHPWRKTCGMFR